MNKLLPLGLKLSKKIVTKMSFSEDDGSGGQKLMSAVKFKVLNFT